MKKLGDYCGVALLDGTELKEKNVERKILLEYYKIKKHAIQSIKLKTFYGITIVKKEYIKDKVKIEKNSISKISTNENKIAHMIEVIKRNKVTPIHLDEIITDLLKHPEFQGE